MNMQRRIDLIIEECDFISLNLIIGTPITRVPIMAKQPLDLYKLFKLVVERGGLVEVSKCGTNLYHYIWDS